MHRLGSGHFTTDLGGSRAAAAHADPPTITAAAAALVIFRRILKNSVVILLPAVEASGNHRQPLETGGAARCGAREINRGLTGAAEQQQIRKGTDGTRSEKFKFFRNSQLPGENVHEVR